MSKFEVNIVKIDDVTEHPNADRLTVVTVGGYKCIANKTEEGNWRYNPGDLVVYIPEDSLLPEWLLKKSGFWNEEKQKGTLSGKAGNRVRPVKLRGIVSQGILYPVYSTIDMYSNPDEPKSIHAINLEHSMMNVIKDQNVAQELNITKYEPVVPANMEGEVGQLYGYTKAYDIENIKKYPTVFTETDNVVMTEKIHGTLCQICIFSKDSLGDDYKNAKTENNIIKIESTYCPTYATVTSKEMGSKGFVQKQIQSNMNNLYVSTLHSLIENGTIANISDNYSTTIVNFRIHVFGKIIGKGVQDLHYSYDTKEFRCFDVFLYDADINTGRYLNDEELDIFCEKMDITRVSVLYRGPYSDKVVNKFTDGNTVEGNGSHIREGIVIRDVNEDNKDIRLPGERKQLKSVSDAYLLRKSGTEYN
jgi:RNA ligase (TIGR02306 family)